MKSTLAVLLLVLVAGCDVSTTDKPKEEKDKTTADKAFDAGQKAKKKAESIKEEQEKKAREADESTNQ